MFSEIKRQAKEIIKGKIGYITKMTSLYFLVILGIWLFYYLIDYYLGNREPLIIEFISMIFLVVYSVLSFGAVAFYVEIAKGNKPKFSTFFIGFSDRLIFKIVLLYLLIQLIIIVGLIIFVIPGIIFMLVLFPANYILYENQDISVVEVIKKCFKITRKAKIRVLLFYLSLTGWYVLGIITLGLLFIYVTPYVSVSTYYLYKSLLEIRDKPQEILVHIKFCNSLKYN